MEINGLPLHPLVVHAAVVFGPLAAILALMYVAIPRWRDRLRWPMLVLAVVAGLAIVAAYLTGDNFRESTSFFQDNAQVEKHAELADKLLWVTIAFSVIAVVNAWFHTRSGLARMVLNTLLVVSAIATLMLVVLTGDAGAKAVWGGAG